MSLDGRKATRVLVMVEYGAAEMADVFDLTELTREIALQPDSKWNDARISLEVKADRDYQAPRTDGRYQVKTEVRWSGQFDLNSTGFSGHLDDVINSGLQDSDRVQRLRKSHEQAKRRAQRLEWAISQQRTEDAAKIRHQHPIARVRLAPELLTQEGAGSDAAVPS